MESAPALPRTIPELTLGARRNIELFGRGGFSASPWRWGPIA